MEADITSQAVGLSSADFSIIKLFLRADIIVKSVIILLIAASVYSWAVIFEKYKYLLTYLLCIQIFEAPLFDSHSTGPQNVSAAFNCHCSSECVKRLVPLSVACLV